MLRSAAFLKFMVFAVIMGIASTFLFLTLSEARTGPGKAYSAVFDDVSDLQSGDGVRISGIRVGTVSSVHLGDDEQVTVDFTVDSNQELTTGTRAVIRYQNLVGDRYLALLDGPGSTRLLPAGSTIPVDRTAPALDIDTLLGGLKPVIQSLNPQDVNALTSSLLQIVQGQEGTLNSLLSNTSSFTAHLADNSQLIEQLINNLRVLMATLADNGGKFSATVDRFEQLISGLSGDADPIGDAITALEQGTASVADLLTQARPPLAGSVDQLARLAPNLDASKDTVDTAIQKTPENLRKLIRIGSYGNFLNYWLCELNLRVNDPSGKVLVLPWFHSDTGRCRG
ncbi:mammalian cell entry protein [Mycobacterium sp. NAZ190054]|nr:mammalian cell entry protein [Mycobacterium sp. NAZ190054]